MEPLTLRMGSDGRAGSIFARGETRVAEIWEGNVLEAEPVLTGGTPLVMRSGWVGGSAWPSDGMFEAEFRTWSSEG